MVIIKYKGQECYKCYRWGEDEGLFFNNPYQSKQNPFWWGFEKGSTESGESDDSWRKSYVETKTMTLKGKGGKVLFPEHYTLNEKPLLSYTYQEFINLQV